MIAFYIVLLVVLIVGGWWWRYLKVKDMADRFGLDTGELMVKDMFGGHGAVERELAEVALSRSEEANRQMNRERAARQKAEQQRQAADHARLASAAAEISIQPATRSVEVRLAELDKLAKQGLVTADEAAARRTEILNEI